jgi:hypothetical protein
MGFALNASEGGVVEGGAVLVQKWVTFMLGFALNGSGGNKETAMDRGWHANGTSFVISRFLTSCNNRKGQKTSVKGLSYLKQTEVGCTPLGDGEQGKYAATVIRVTSSSSTSRSL